MLQRRIISRILSFVAHMQNPLVDDHSSYPFSNCNFSILVSFPYEYKKMPSCMEISKRKCKCLFTQEYLVLQMVMCVDLIISMFSVWMKHAPRFPAIGFWGHSPWADLGKDPNKQANHGGKAHASVKIIIHCPPQMTK